MVAAAAARKGLLPRVKSQVTRRGDSVKYGNVEKCVEQLQTPTSTTLKWFKLRTRREEEFIEMRTIDLVLRPEFRESVMEAAGASVNGVSEVDELGSSLEQGVQGPSSAEEATYNEGRCREGLTGT